MGKRYIQGLLCVIAIAHLYLYSPSRIDGTIGDSVSVVYYMAWELKRLLMIPAIYSFLILAVQFLWPAAKSRGADTGE